MVKFVALDVDNNCFAIPVVLWLAGHVGVRFQSVGINAVGTPSIVGVLGTGVELSPQVHIWECALVRVRIPKAAVGPGGVGPIAVDTGGTPTVLLLGAASLVGLAAIFEVHTGLPSHSGAAILDTAGETQVWRWKPVLFGAVP